MRTERDKGRVLNASSDANNRKKLPQTQISALQRQISIYFSKWKMTTELSLESWTESQAICSKSVILQMRILYYITGIL